MEFQRGKEGNTEWGSDANIKALEAMYEKENLRYVSLTIQENINMKYAVWENA